MTDLLLIIHILAAAAWIGGGFLSAFVGPRMGRNPGEGVALGWARVAAEAKRGAIWSAITAVLLIVAVVVMVLKTGVG